jgi:hypothetical protein
MPLFAAEFGFKPWEFKRLTYGEIGELGEYLVKRGPKPRL